MKKILLVLSVLTALLACKDKNEATSQNEQFANFGAKIKQENVLTTAEMQKKYESMKAGDTVNVQFESTINAVCKKKGCWMTMNLGDKKEAFVKFKDYAFFVPKNADKSEAIVSGKAFVAIESVDELKHYAKDTGKSQASIDSIITPKTTYSFMADGVSIRK